MSKGAFKSIYGVATQTSERYQNKHRRDTTPRDLRKTGTKPAMTPTTDPEPRPSLIRIWWQAIRPATLAAGAAPVVLASMLAHRDGALNFFAGVAALLGALCLQIGCNFVNDYADFETGADDQDRLGPARAAQKGWLSVSDLKRGAITSLGLAGLLGVYLTMVGGWPILTLGICSILAAIAYTAGPFPLAYLGLGDVFVLIFFGFGAVCGTYFVHHLTLTPEIWVWGYSVGALATAILVVNNLRDRHTDTKVGKRTLAVRFGATAARVQYTVLICTAYVLPITFYLFTPSVTDPWTMNTILVLNLGYALRANVWAIWRTDGAGLNPYLGKTGFLEILLSVSVIAGILLN